MAEYSKQTVANLRQILKDRGIPSTGLTRKAQIIEKLEEWDAQAEGGEEEAVEEEGNDVEVEGKGEEEKAITAVEEQPAQAETEVQTEVPSASGASEPEPEPAPAPAPAPAPTAEENKQSAEPSAPAEPEEQAPPTMAEPEPDSTPAGPAQTEPKPQPEDTRMEQDKTASPEANEKPSVEKAELLPVPERSANTTAETSRLNTEELEADRKKRKRRSDSPDLPTQDIKAKRPRPSQEPSAPDVILKKDQDEDVVMEQRRPNDEEKPVEQETKEDTNGTDGVKAKEEATETQADLKSPDAESDAKRDKKEKAPRFRELFQPAADDATPADAITDDRPIVPALHAATPALYIRNFMRPLRPEPLRAHLVSLASPPSSSPDPSIVKALFLDAMKTHALVLLSTTTAASRVRASLHGSIWPPESMRKELWVDFVPEDRVEEWIKEEEDAISAEKEARARGNPIPAKRFEVVYPESPDGNIAAVFQEVGANVATNATTTFNPPRGPRAALEPTSRGPPPQQQAPTEALRTNMSKSFATLSDLFDSTTAKPKLYFLPVSDDIADQRLKDLDHETSHDWDPEERRRGRGIQGRLDEKVRFGFDGENRVVEVGGDFGPWADERAGMGGRGGRGGGGAGRGGWRGGRGGSGGFRGGGNWRG